MGSGAASGPAALPHREHKHPKATTATPRVRRPQADRLPDDGRRSIFFLVSPWKQRKQTLKSQLGD
jgi:hypothetical protein